MAKNYRRQYKSFIDVVENGLDGRVSRKLQYATYLQVRDRDGDGNITSVALRYHSTDVLLFTEEGVTYNSGGWRTVTTRSRMNEYGPVQVYQKNWEWYCNRWGRHGEAWDYYEGMMIDYEGVLLNPDPAGRVFLRSASNFMKREVNHYLQWVMWEFDKEASLFLPFGATPTPHVNVPPTPEQYLDMVLDQTYSPELLIHGMRMRGIPSTVGLLFRCGIDSNGIKSADFDERFHRAELRKTLFAPLKRYILDNEEMLLAAWNETTPV